MCSWRRWRRWAAFSAGRAYSHPEGVVYRVSVHAEATEGALGALALKARGARDRAPLGRRRAGRRPALSLGPGGGPGPECARAGSDPALDPPLLPAPHRRAPDQRARLPGEHLLRDRQVARGGPRARRVLPRPARDGGGRKKRAKAELRGAPPPSAWRGSSARPPQGPRCSSSRCAGSTRGRSGTRSPPSSSPGAPTSTTRRCASTLTGPGSASSRRASSRGSAGRPTPRASSGGVCGTGSRAGCPGSAGAP